MLRLIILFGILALIGCQAKSTGSEYLIGKWKSDEKRTLDSMNSVDGVTPKARKLFESDFFGSVIIEYRADVVRSIDEKEDYVSDFVPYEVIEVTDKYIRIKEWSDLLQEYEEWNIYMEGDCYYVITSKFNFKEYFCRYG